MASYKDTIKLQDLVSPVLSRVVKIGDQAIRTMDRFNRSMRNSGMTNVFRRMRSDIDSAGAGMRTLMNRIAGGINPAERLRSIIQSLPGALNRAHQSMSNFVRTLSHGIHIAKNVGRIVSEVMQGVDLAKSQVARAQMFNTGTMTGEQVYGAAYKVAQETRSDLAETSNLINKLMLSGVFDAGDNAAASIGMAGIINKALIAGGGTAEENKRALLQLNQGLASGLLQGDELRSIREQSPYLMKVLSKGLGKIDKQFEGLGIGDMKALGAAGELTSDRIVQAFAAMKDDIQADFDLMPKTFGQGLLSVANTWQYFLYLLSKADGPLQKLTDMIWSIANYLESPEGATFLYELASGINFVINVLWNLFTVAGKVFQFLVDHSDIVKAALMALAIVWIASWGSMAIATLAATWPLLLIIAIIGTIIYIAMQLGATAGQIIGAIIGAIGFLIAIIVNVLIVALMAIIGVIEFIAQVAIAAVGIFITGILFVVQLIMWGIELIITIIYGLWDVIRTVALAAKGAVISAVSEVVSKFVTAGIKILEVINKIAAAMDFVFGTNFSNTVNGWINSLSKFQKGVESLKDKEGINGSVTQISEVWSKFGNDMKTVWGGDHNLYKAMGSTLNKTSDMMRGTHDAFSGIQDFLAGGLQSPTEWFSKGMDWGLSLDEKGFDSSLLDSLTNGPLGDADYLSSLLGNQNIDNIDKVGSVGKIDSDVSISDEDIKLMRDMAARDYLLQLQQVTPVANVTFGDVRETADVNRILDVIETMVEEQLATSMVS